MAIAREKFSHIFSLLCASPHYVVLNFLTPPGRTRSDGRRTLLRLALY